MHCRQYRGPQFYGRGKLHDLCDDQSVTLEALEVLLQANAQAASEMDNDGDFPLHNLCMNTSVTLEMPEVLHKANEQAARRICVKTCHFTCCAETPM